MADWPLDFGSIPLLWRGGCIIRAVFLEVRESNDPAKRLYERAGFETVGRRTGYYAHPVEDALVLSVATAREAR